MHCERQKFVLNHFSSHTCKQYYNITPNYYEEFAVKNCDMSDISNGIIGYYCSEFLWNFFSSQIASKTKFLDFQIFCLYNENFFFGLN